MKKRLFSPFVSLLAFLALLPCGLAQLKPADIKSLVQPATEARPSLFAIFHQYWNEKDNVRQMKDKLIILEKDQKKAPEKIGALIENIKKNRQTTSQLRKDKSIPPDEKKKRLDGLQKKQKVLEHELSLLNANLKTIPTEIEETHKKIKQLELELQKTSRLVLLETFSTTKKFLIVFSLFIFFLFLRFIFKKVIISKTDDPNKIFLFNKGTHVFTFVFILFLILYFVFENLTYFVAIVGFAAAGVAIALREVFTSIVGWFILIGSKQIKVGDRVIIGDVTGEVLNITLLKTTLLEFPTAGGQYVDTGRAVFLTNNYVFNQKIVNYNFGNKYVSQKISLVLTFESNWKKANKLFLECVEKETREIFQKANTSLKYVQRNFGIHMAKKEPMIYMNIADHGIELVAIYVSKIAEAFVLKDSLHRKLMDIIEREKDIELAYPTQRIIPTPLPDKTV